MRKEGIRPAFARLKIVIFETFRVRDSSSAVMAQSRRSICSARDNGCPAVSEARTVLDGSCGESRASDEKGLCSQHVWEKVNEFSRSVSDSSASVPFEWTATQEESRGQPVGHTSQKPTSG